MIKLLDKDFVVTSYYGKRKFMYQGKLYLDFHTGIDLAPREKKARVLAFETGTVVSVVKTGKQYGQACFVRIKHDNGLYTLYYHLENGSISVKKGQRVKKGQFLGIAGKTGKATGIHLHFQIDKGSNGTSIDPIPYLLEEISFFSKDENKDDIIRNRNYMTTDDMFVRAGAGTIYHKKLVKDLTEDGKRNATSKNENALAVYKKGTVYTALDIVKNKYGMWAKTPSGYVCMIGASGKSYFKKA